MKQPGNQNEHTAELLFGHPVNLTLEVSGPKTRNFVFTRKKFNQQKSQISGTFLIRAPRASVHQLFWHLLTLCLLLQFL
jgi:hypothetical protein